MSWSASVRVVDDDGQPRHGRAVSISFGGLWGYETVYTDDDGWAEFNYESIDAASLPVSYLSIDGDTVATDISLADGDTLSFTTE